MRLLISTLFLFSSFPLLAAIGDLSELTGTWVSNCGKKSETFQTISQILRETEDPGHRLVDIRVTQIVGNKETQFEESAAFAFDPTSLETEEKVRGFCGQAHGVVEQITVPAGTFWTCRLSGQNSSRQVQSWIGPVPFGIVQWNEQRMEFNDPQCQAKAEQKLVRFRLEN